jgi:Galactose oxidase, central domain
MFYHADHQRVESVRNDGVIASWNGTTWTQRSPAIPGFQRGGVCYDRVEQRVIVSGALNGVPAVVEFDPMYGSHTVTPPGGMRTDNLTYDEGRRLSISMSSRDSSGASVYHPVAWNAATDTWTKLTASTVRPPARNDAAMAADASRGAILFGGTSATGVTNDTWLWDGTKWRDLKLVNAPPPRSAAGMTSWGNQVLLYGGRSASGQPLGDTWVCTAIGWHVLPILSSPQPRYDHALATDPNGAGYPAYLFGGSNGQQWFDDLRRLTQLPGYGGYYWDWTPVQTVGSPGARDVHAMAIDTTRGKLVLFGGRNEYWQQHNDTWELNLSGPPTWTQRFPAHTPPGRINHGMAYDQKRQRTVLVGGHDLETGSYFDDIWEWDGSDWAQRIPGTRSIAPTDNAGICYDARRDRVVMFGGWANGGPSDNTYEIVENIGPAAPYQNAPLTLTVTRAPIVSGGVAVRSKSSSRVLASRCST